MPSKLGKNSKLNAGSHLARARSSGCARSREMIHAFCEGDDGDDDGDAAPPRLSVEESAALAGIAASEDADDGGDVGILQYASCLSQALCYRCRILQCVWCIERRVLAEDRTENTREQRRPSERRK